MHLHVRYFVGFILAFVLLILAIVGAAVQWYSVGPISWYLTYASVGSSTCQYGDSGCTSGDQKTMFYLILACCVVAIILDFVNLIILGIFTFSHLTKRLRFRRHFRVPLIVMATFVLLLCIGAWCLLFWFPKACSSCSNNDWKFTGDGYGPEAGWYLYIVCTVIAFILWLICLLGGSVDDHGYTIF